MTQLFEICERERGYILEKTQKLFTVFKQRSLLYTKKPAVSTGSNFVTSENFCVHDYFNYYSFLVVDVLYIIMKGA